MFYVYVYLNEEGEPFYVGKGTGKRIDWKYNRPFELPPPDKRVKVFDNLTEEQSLEREQALIELLGKDNLLNKTTGGQGVSGLRFNQSKDWCEMMSERNKGKLNPFYGKKHSEETRKKMREAAARRDKEEFAEKQRAALCVNNYYKFLNPEGKSVIVEGSLNKFCKETGLNTGAMSQVHRGNYEAHKGWRKG